MPFNAYARALKCRRINMYNDLEKILFTAEDIAEKVKGAADWLDKKYSAAQYMPLAVCVLKGSVFFFCDVVRAMRTPVQLDFMAISSYGNGTVSLGEIKIVSDLAASVDGRDVIIIEDIVDTGRTLAGLKRLLFSRGAKSVACVALADKPSRRETDVNADYRCFTVGDEFIVGYGLDYAQKYRNLPCIGVLKDEIYR